MRLPRVRMGCACYREGWKDGKGEEPPHLCQYVNAGWFGFSGLVLKDNGKAVGLAKLGIGALSSPGPQECSKSLVEPPAMEVYAHGGSLERTNFQQQGACRLHAGDVRDGQRQTGSQGRSLLSQRRPPMPSVHWLTCPEDSNRAFKLKCT